MPYDKGAVKAAIDLIGLAPRSQRFFDSWLGAWAGNGLPSEDEFPNRKVRDLQPCLLMTAVKPNESARVTYVGSALKQAFPRDVTGLDWVSLAPQDSRAERIRRLTAVARGAILRSTAREQLAVKSTIPYVFETLSLPLKPHKDGTTTVIHFHDWAPPKDEAKTQYKLKLTVPQLAELIPLVTDRHHHITPKFMNDGPGNEGRAKIISRAAMRFVLHVLEDAAQMPAEAQLDLTDYVIAVAVGCANVSHIENNPALSQKYAGLVEPDVVRRGISRAAISRATSIPLETVRRRINNLIRSGVLLERDDGIILSAGNRHKIGVRLDLMHKHAQLFDRTVREIKARGG